MVRRFDLISTSTLRATERAFERVAPRLMLGLLIGIRCELLRREAEMDELSDTANTLPIGGMQ